MKEYRMASVSKAMAYRKLVRGAAILAVLVPVGLLGACADTPPPPPPPPPPAQPAPPPPPPPPPPAPVPPARG
jgi:hypothetical protein